MEEIKDPLLEEVIAGIGYSPITCFLVKPLEPIMVSKDITTMKPNGVKDEDGIEGFDTETETKEVESNFKEGIVLKLPLQGACDNVYIGTRIVYNKKFAIDFDLFKDSQLVKPFDIVAIKD
jgi:hypothetical protein